MNFYEAVFIVRQGASTPHVEAVTQEIVELIKSLGGEITKTEFCGLRQLAYPIKKNNKGYYVLLNIANANNNISELERKFRLHEDIIRYLIIRVDKLDNSPSALLRKPNESSREKGE
ncbi:MAG: 30S ribosomal protein S6 [Alphaproteobacteria bacterium]|nr:30S ribosomal protein S6 [Alphaproteobacteria bacterium]